MGRRSGMGREFRRNRGCMPGCLGHRCALRACVLWFVTCPPTDTAQLSSAWLPRCPCCIRIRSNHTARHVAAASALHYTAFALVLAAAACDRHAPVRSHAHVLAVSETRKDEEYSPLRRSPLYRCWEYATVPELCGSTKFVWRMASTK